MRPPIVVALAAALSSLSALAADAPASQPSPQIVHYDVSGNSARELRSQLNAFGPRDPITQQRFDGRTDWSLNWSFQFATSTRGCELASFGVSLDSIITLPRWTPPTGASVALQQEWQRYSAALRHHEDGHHDTAVATADALRARLQERLDGDATAPDCKQLGRELDALGRQAVLDGRRQGREYDRDTGHGRTQGARF